MLPKRPADLPDQRLEMLEKWRPPDGFYFQLAKLAAERRVTNREMPLDPVADYAALVQAQLWWITADMCRLIDHAAKSLPPTTLTEDLLAAPFGLAVFEEPFVGVDVDSADPIEVKAMLWGSGTLRVLDRESVAISCYGDASEFNAKHNFPLREELYPQGRTDWCFGEDTEAVVDPEDHWDHVRLNSMSEDRRFFAAMMLLASQPLTETTDTKAPRPVARRCAREEVSSDVRIVDLRKRARPLTEGGADKREVNWSHRWIVGGETGGFWRQQAYGPNRSLRRPVWINEYVKGPADKPLKLKETVRILRSDQ